MGDLRSSLNLQIDGYVTVVKGHWACLKNLFIKYRRNYQLQPKKGLQYWSQVNNFIEGAPVDPIDKVGGQGADDEFVSASGSGSTSTSQVGGIGSVISALPNAIGQAAVSVIR